MKGRASRPRLRLGLWLSVTVVVVAAIGIAPVVASDPADAEPAPATLDDLSQRTPTEFGSTEGDDLRAWLVRGAPEEVQVGADVYANHCSVCHGDTGLGYQEAKLSFPEDHRTCTRCHRPGNEREMTFAKMMERQHDLFDVGDAPAVRGPGSLAAFPSDDALFAYMRATMPRYQPGRLSDADYQALVTFLRWIDVDGEEIEGGG